MDCKICSGKLSRLFKHLVLNKYPVNYYRCDSCGFVCTEEPFWLSEAYSRPINVCDTGIVSRNEKLRDALAFLFHTSYSSSARFLDYAGGYGLLTRMMRDSGYDFYWHDPYTENLFVKGFEHSEDYKPYSALTCGECFEHFVDPVKEINEMLLYGRRIFLTTTLIPMEPPKPEEWDYYGFTHGQHVSFYTQRSLTQLAERLNLGVASNGRQFHFLGENPPTNFLLRLAYSPLVRLLPLFLKSVKGSLMEKDHDRMKLIEHGSD